ncbi:M24 family metallopeptidase [Microbacterium sp. ZW T5_56]|uniref:M24 family metallopeptidase n=1 Tax=Microbacterium sp. ZW T5_56 TaxID=3378081 RepID=UPI003851CFF3
MASLDLYPTLPPSARDRAVKQQRVLDILDGTGTGAVWLTSPAALSWYLDGSRVQVGPLGDPVLAVRISPDGDRVRVFTNEADRLIAEELPAGLDVEHVPWHGTLVDAAPDDADERALAAELRAARGVLLPAETERYARLSTDAATAMTAALAAADPAESERAIAARLAAELWQRGIEPVVLLVAGEGRLPHRHPLPTAAPVGSRAMAVVCGRRHGLIANLTRWVRFRPATAAERDANTRIRDVEAAFFTASVPGRSFGEILATGATAYERAGFAADEWQRHHQGGAAGYNGRDPRATPGLDELLQDGQAFTWNPSAPGAKIEDTVLISAGRVRVLTLDPSWPTSRHEGLERPDELEL